jgi:carbon storage regulator
MLVLRRKVGESIVLAGVINISVLAVEGERVKIGISAPPDITIVREELLRAPVTDTAPSQGQGSSISPASQR